MTRNEMIQTAFLKHATLSKSPTFSEEALLPKFNDFVIMDNDEHQSSSSDSTLRNQSVADLNQSEDEFWIENDRNTSSCDSQLSLGWSSAGGTDDFDRRAESEVAALLSSLEEKLYQEDPSKKIDSRLLEDCHSWRQTCSQLRVVGRNIWPNLTESGVVELQTGSRSASNYGSASSTPRSESNKISIIGSSIEIQTNEEIFASDGQVEEILAINQSSTADKLPKATNSKERIDAIISQLVDIELNEISSQYEECLEAYNSAHSTNPQIHSSFIVSDSSSFISSSYSRSPRSASSLRSNSSTITPTNRPLSRQRVPPDIGLGPRQSTDISGYLFREGSRLRNFAETTRNFSRGSFVESRQYSKQQQHAELNEMMVKSISSKPVKPRQPMNAYDYHRLNHNPPSRLRNQRPSTTQTQRDRDNILRRTKHNRRLEPLNRSKTPHVLDNRITEAMITTSFILSEREPSKSSSFIDHRSSPYARLPHIGENALEKISEGHRLGRRRPLSHLTKYFQK